MIDVPGNPAGRALGKVRGKVLKKGIKKGVWGASTRVPTKVRVKWSREILSNSTYNSKSEKRKRVVVFYIPSNFELSQISATVHIKYPFKH